MEWLNEWTKDQLADYFVAARSLMNDKAGAITDRDWSTLNGRIARPIAEMKQLRDTFGQLILAEESTPEQFITAVQNRDVTEFDVHRSTVNTSKTRRNTKLSARAAEGQATEEAVRSNTRSAKRAAAMKNTREPHAAPEPVFFTSTTTDLADSTDDVALVLAFGLGSSSSLLPSAPTSNPPALSRPGSNSDPMGINSFMRHDDTGNGDETHRNGGMKGTSNGFGNASTAPNNNSSSQHYTTGSKKAESKTTKVSGRKIRLKTELDNDPILPLPTQTILPQAPVSKIALPPVNTAPLLEMLDTALGGPHGDALRRFATYEWFYPNIDQDWFQHSDFLSMLHSLHLGRMETGTKAQWNLVRRAFGNPRRMSKNFFHQERDKLEQHRSYVRLLRPSRGGPAPSNSAHADPGSPRSSVNAQSAEHAYQAQLHSAPTSQPHLEHVALHSAYANPNDSVDEMWANDTAGDPNALGIRIGMGTLGASNAQGVGFISKDKSQVIPKGTRVVVWTKGILSTRPSATAVHTASARKRYNLPDPALEVAPTTNSIQSAGKLSSVDVSTSTIHEEDEDSHESDTDGEESLDGTILEDGEADEASDSLAESELPPKSKASSNTEEASNAPVKPSSTASSAMDVDEATCENDSTVRVSTTSNTALPSSDVHQSSSEATLATSSSLPFSLSAAARLGLIAVPSEGRSGSVVLMPSEVVSGRVVKCKKDNTYQVQLAGALENGSHVVTVDDTHIMSCDVNRVSAKRRSAVNTYKVEFNQHEVPIRLHPLAGADQTDVLKTVMLQTPHFFEPDYNLTAIVMLLLDWKEVTLSSMGKALDTLEKSKRTLDAVDAGTKNLAVTSVASLRNKYNSSEAAVKTMTERLHVINEQLAQYRPNLIERRVMVASSHLVASAVQSSRTLADVALSMVPPPTLSVAKLAAARSSEETTNGHSRHPSSSSSSSDSDSNGSAREKAVGGEGGAKTSEEKKDASMDVSATETAPAPETPTKKSDSSDSNTDAPKSTTGGEDGANNSKDQTAQPADLSSPTADGLAALTSLGKTPEREAEIRRLEDESMMTLTEMLISTPTKLRAVPSGLRGVGAPLALTAASSNPLLPSLTTPRSRSFSLATLDSMDDLGGLMMGLGDEKSEEELPAGYQSEPIRNRVASSLALIKVLAQDGISADVREATVKVALSILQAAHHSQNNSLFESIKAQCDELLHVLAHSERF